MHSTKDDGHRVGPESSVELFSDVIVTDRVLHGQVEQVILAEDVIATLTPWNVLLGAMLGLVPAAPAENVHLDVFAQFFGEFFSFDFRRAVRTEPGDRDALASDVDPVVVVQRLFSLEFAHEMAFHAVPDEMVVAVDVGRNVGIPPEGERPVEEIGRNLVERPRVVRIAWRFKVVEDVALLRPSVGRNVASVEIRPHVEHEGAAEVGHSTVGRDPAVGHGALDEQIVLEAESGDHSVRISVPFGPEQNHLRFEFQ